MGKTERGKGTERGLEMWLRANIGGTFFFRYPCRLHCGVFWLYSAIVLLLNSVHCKITVHAVA